MLFMKVKRIIPEEVMMAKKESKERGGLCCPHCADSKYPCVTMERQMRKGSEKVADTEEKEEE